VQPLLRFVSSHEPADRIVEVPVNMPSTEPFDPLRIVKAFLWEVPGIEQPERLQPISLCLELRRFGNVVGNDTDSG